MVNRIDQLNYGNPYITKSKKVSSTETEAPAFLLQNDEEGVVWDRGDTKKKQVKPPQKEKNVTIEKQQQATVIEKTVQEDILIKIRNFFQKCFRFIWYGDETVENLNQQDTKKSDILVVESNKSLNLKDNSSMSDEEKIEDYLKKKDTDGIMKVLTNNHTITPARNTSLLTYYDRHGMLVNLGRTNTERILHGDRKKNTYLDSM